MEAVRRWKRRTNPNRYEGATVTAPEPSYRTIPLPGGYTALVDAEDYARIASYEWRVQINTRRNGGPNLLHVYAHTDDGKVYMHAVVMNRKWIDHRNHNGLDNRKHNLRPCTNQQNQRNARLRRDNTSGFKGCSPSGGRWRAAIRLGLQSQTYLGLFATKEEAARAYDAAAKKHFGEFAVLNFPERKSQ